MNKIFKYPLVITDRQTVQIPKSAKILSVQYQQSTLCMWALVDTAEPLEFRTICIFGTGHEIKNTAFLKYIATVQAPTANLVWHVFEYVI